MSWKQVLSDKKKYADDVKVNIDGIEVTIGELRTAQAEEAAAVAAQKKQLEQAQAETAKLYADLIKYDDDLKKQAAAVTAPKKNEKGEFDYETDPLLGPLARQIKALQETELKKLNDTVEAQKKEFQQISAYYFNEKWQRDFEGLKDKPKDVKLEDVLRFATENKITDRMGVPDVREAARRMNEPNRIEAIKEEARREGYKKAQEEALMGTMSRNGIGVSTGKPEATAYKSLDEAIAAMRKDTDLAAALANFDPAQLA